MLAVGVMHNIEPGHHAVRQEVDWIGQWGEGGWGREMITAHHKVGESRGGGDKKDKR